MEREGARWKQALVYSMGLTLPVASSIMGRRSPDEWEAAGKPLASLHQTDVLKVSNQCSPRALLLWQSTPSSLHSSHPPSLLPFVMHSPLVLRYMESRPLHLMAMWELYFIHLSTVGRTQHYPKWNTYFFSTACCSSSRAFLNVMVTAWSYKLSYNKSRRTVF